MKEKGGRGKRDGRKKREVKRVYLITSVEILPVDMEEDHFVKKSVPNLKIRNLSFGTSSAL